MTVGLSDLAEYSVRAWFLLFLCKDRIFLKEKYRSVGKVLFFLQAFLINLWLSCSEWVNKVLYKNAAGEIWDSSYSIIKLVIILCCSFAAMDILYQGSRIAKLYLVLVFYTIQEMAKFTLHSIWSFVTVGCIDYLYECVVAEKIDADSYMIAAKYLQTYSIWLYTAGYLFLMYMVLRSYRHYMIGSVDEINSQGLCFLMLTPVIGMAFDVSWRISFFRQQGTEIEFLYEKHESMYVVVPVIAVLCLVCTVLGRKIYSELMRAEDEKNSLLFYKQQVADMTAHVRELEQLYDGIRGMRHDVNNYVADMEQLLCAETGKEQLSDKVRQEAEGYLRNMRQAAARLSLQFSTGNPVTDVILNRKGQICAQEGIELTGDLIYPVQLCIEAFDLGILLNNALDNAIEACRKVPEDGEKLIHFRGYTKGRMFFVVVENTYDGTVWYKEKDGLWTTKEDGGLHGFGMNNMRRCVEKYYGTMQYEAGEKYFVLTIMMQGKCGT